MLVHVLTIYIIAYSINFSYQVILHSTFDQNDIRQPFVEINIDLVMRKKKLYSSQTGAILMSITESCGKSSNIYSHNSIVDSCKIDWLIVKANDSDLKIPLPSTFGRDVLPANRAHKPADDMAKSWPQLEKIANKSSKRLRIRILIGYNCARV